MKSIILVLSVFAANAAVAKDKLVCQFTEPFFNVTFDANTGVAMYVGADSYDVATDDFIPKELSKKAILKLNINPKLNGPEYIVVDMATGSTILELNLDGQGSDGMSDALYVFSAKYAGISGGCYTDTAPVVDKDTVIDELTN